MPLRCEPAESLACAMQQHPKISSTDAKLAADTVLFPLVEEQRLQNAAVPRRQFGNQGPHLNSVLFRYHRRMHVRAGISGFRNARIELDHSTFVPDVLHHDVIAHGVHIRSKPLRLLKTFALAERSQHPQKHFLLEILDLLARPQMEAQLDKQQTRKVSD